MDSKPGENTLYASSDGKVQVTSRRLVVGGEQWDISGITGVTLASKKNWKFGNWLKLNSRTMPNIGIAALCLLVGFGMALLAALVFDGFMEGVCIALAVLVYFAGFYFIWRTYILSLDDKYSLRITVQNEGGGPKEHSPAYTWTDPLQAREVEQALLQAIAQR